MPRTSACRRMQSSSARQRSGACSNAADCDQNKNWPRSQYDRRRILHRRTLEVSVATVGRDIKSVELTDRELWLDGPPLEAFKQMRSKCPVHWTDGFEELPDEAGFWSVTTAEDVHTVSRDWQTYSSEAGGVLVAAAGFPLELAQAMFIGMDPPKHDRLKALFQKGFTPKRIADHEDAIRAITVGVLDKLVGRDECDLVT